ncbi:hypothetical protein COW81_01115 [Candidatus Campbellbacteria bacterium CG22_combo_CG10-13_8_21_14_all_36_13]|uniref:Endonuclease/exonuclease/phosphatase domain-containing protein n=1 Tax=Candidatus Campbellbacteria bacterium CG22_combo_CG10-13_8_21_14_all_36_13 TaxID=1974529 RepID=A0A2H0DZ85_9BACT|nr:MAG: hypothetical protein COW81_01115 [Candidatus Campbellbacteria bacterium CG22_combo_CG10-13_8_21_14_all_36_13]
MKLISLNTWGGRAGKAELLSFFEKHKDVDIFCLQEILSAPYEKIDGQIVDEFDMGLDQTMSYGMQEISSALAGHASYFRPHYLNTYGLLMLVKKDIEVIKEGDFFVYKSSDYVPMMEDIGLHARNVQYTTVQTERGIRTFMNFHGLWDEVGKVNTKDRLIQSDKIISFLSTLPTPIILCGDFNLRPDTESIKKFEDFGLRNLIKEYGVTSTRTSYYAKPEKFADYAFVSDGVKVLDFKVLPDEVSDHSPLYLEFD